MQSHDLPLNADPSGKYVPWIVALMVYLATISLIIATMVSGIVKRWDLGLVGRLTVELPAPNLMEDDRHSQYLTDQVKKTLMQMPGAGNIRQLSSNEVLKIIEPWVGGKQIILDPEVLPILFDVELMDRKFVNLPQLKQKLHKLHHGITIEDHLGWQEGLLDLAHSAKVIGFSIVSMILFAAICIIAFTAQTSLIIHRQVIEILYLIGATDDYIAKQFQHHALQVGIKGGAIGIGLFTITYILLNFFSRNLDTRIIHDILSPTGIWAIACIIPIAITGLMMISARLTVRVALRYIV